MINKKSLCIQLTCLVIGLFFATIAFAQDTETQKENWLLGLISKLEIMRDDAVVKIRDADTQILRDENMIRKAEKMIELSIEERDSEAEGIARQELAVAQNEKAKAQEVKRIAELEKLRAEESIERVRNLLSENQPEETEKVYCFYWTIRFLTPTGHFIITDGTYIEKHKSYEEALEACQENARSVMPMLSTVNELTCYPQYIGGQPVGP